MTTPKLESKLRESVEASAVEKLKARVASLRERLSAANAEIEQRDEEIAELKTRIESLLNPEPPKYEAPEGPTKFRIREAKTIYVAGAMTDFTAGQIVSLSVHGAHAIKMMRGAGMLLDPIED